MSNHEHNPMRDINGTCVLCGTDHSQCSKCGFDMEELLGSYQAIHPDWMDRLEQELGYDPFQHPLVFITFLGHVFAGDLEAVRIYKSIMLGSEFLCMDCGEDFATNTGSKGITLDAAYQAISIKIEKVQAKINQRMKELSGISEEQATHVQRTIDSIKSDNDDNDKEPVN